MIRILLLAVALFVGVSARPALAQRFAAIALHDVADDERELGPDDIVTARLIALFDWLRGNGWTAISLDDVDAARRGIRALPSRPILITFDDGYRSAYTRVFPLLLAYRMPAVFALVGSWMDAPDTATVRYGDTDVPRGKFLSWAEAREMQASGLAEFASHSYGLHTGVPGNAFGSRFPAAAAWQFDPKSGTRESDAALRARVRADLDRSRALMVSRLGRAPRALVWPFGRYAGPALQAAVDTGFSFALGLNSEPADAGRPMDIPRFYPSGDPKLGSMAEALRFDDPRPLTRRIACLDPAPLR